jgi:hypothetical protein
MPLILRVGTAELRLKVSDVRPMSSGGVAGLTV